MESYNKNFGNQTTEKKDDKVETDNWRKGRVWAGLIVIAVGAIWIAREAGADIPRWVTSGPMLLVALGFFIGARSNFKNWVWLIPMGIGFALIADRYWFFEFNIKEFIWPTVIIVIGLFMIFKPKGKKNEWGDWRNHSTWNTDGTPLNSSEGMLDSVSVFGSIQKNILSKDFRGGSVVSFLGGTELNLSQADLTKPAVLEMTQVFGGSKLIVPANWTIESKELVSVFGGIEDKRMVAQNPDPNKVLILTGTNVFGGLEIKSF